MNKKKQLIEAYNEKKYRVVDHTTENDSGQPLADVQMNISASPDIYVWAHYGHGASHSYGDLSFFGSIAEFVGKKGVKWGTLSPKPPGIFRF